MCDSVKPERKKTWVEGGDRQDAESAQPKYMIGDPFKQSDKTTSDGQAPDKDTDTSVPQKGVALPLAGRVTTKYKKEPDPLADDKKIHPRRPLPTVPEHPPEE